MTDDLSDLLGPSTPKRTRKTIGRDTKKVFDEPDLILDEPMPHEREFLRPVGATFLARILGKQTYQITKRLARCPTVGHHMVSGQEQPLYDFATAMSYLVPPKGNIEEWFAQQNAASLPPFVNKMWWDSAAQRARVMLTQGQLWHDEDVRLVLGRVSMQIRQEIKMWIEDLPEKDMLTDRQYNALVDATHRLVDQVREALVNGPREVVTKSMAHTIKDELDEASGVAE